MGATMAKEKTMATAYAINIHMSGDTVQKLINRNFYLFGFKGVRTGGKGGVPLVWIKSNNFSLSTTVDWQEVYEAYTSTSVALDAKTKITASASYRIELGQILKVTSTAGTGNVETQGHAGVISILNTVSKEFNCGISQQTDVGIKPLCAVPLSGNDEDRIEPIERVLLSFATEPVDLGTVIVQAFSQGILIDMTGATGNQRDVTYDKDAGWSWGTGTWAQTISADENIVQYLIL
jgi:hypothetical protein